MSCERSVWCFPKLSWTSNQFCSYYAQSRTIATRTQDIHLRSNKPLSPCSDTRRGLQQNPRSLMCVRWTFTLYICELGIHAYISEPVEAPQTSELASSIRKVPKGSQAELWDILQDSDQNWSSICAENLPNSISQKENLDTKTVIVFFFCVHC